MPTSGRAGREGGANNSCRPARWSRGSEAIAERVYPNPNRSATWAIEAPPPT
ncbi:MAG TPA: hypothetical protein VI248_19890 [Kineosporiaceae bacterium]